MDGLTSWFRKQNGTVDVDSMNLAQLPEHGWGAIALRDIPQGHTLFAIPRTLTLSTRTSSLPSLLGEKAWKQFKLDKGWAGLILCMMWEEAQGEKSKWAAYLNSLPTTFDTLMFWSVEDLEELKGTTVVDKIGKEETERDYREKLTPALQSREDLFPRELTLTHYSLDRYHVMGNRILSRSFVVEKWESDSVEAKGDVEEEPKERGKDDMDVDEEPVIPQGDTGGETQEEENPHEGDDDDDDDDDPSDIAMVPMADMLNARYGSENAKLFHEEAELKMATTKAIKAGEQIWNTYGDPPNADLLRRYGHVDLVPLPDGREGNPADVVEVPANMVVDAVVRQREHTAAADGSDLKERIDWWLEEGGDDVFVLEMDYAIPDSFISLVKLLTGAAQDWDKARDKGKPPRPKMDAQVVRIAMSVLEARLAQYPTPVEADEKLLKDASAGSLTLSMNKRHAIIVRLGEKRVLSGALTVLKTMAEGTHANGAGGEKEKRKRMSGDHAEPQGRNGKEKRSKR